MGARDVEPDKLVIDNGDQQPSPAEWQEIQQNPQAPRKLERNKRTRKSALALGI